MQQPYQFTPILSPVWIALHWSILACCVHWNLISTNSVIRVTLLAICAFLYLIIGWIYSDVLHVSTAWVYLIGSIASVLVVLVVGVSPSSNKTSYVQNAWSYLGKISYGLYMWHVPASWIVAASLASWRLDLATPCLSVSC